MAAKGSPTEPKKGAKAKKKGRPWKSEWRRRGKSKIGGEIGYSVERAGEILGISKSKAYALVDKGEIPWIKLGSTYIVPRIAFHEKFGPLPPQGGAAAA